jgi:hypothetical protein
MKALKTLLLVAGAAGLGWFLWREYPAVVRYIKMERM